MHIDFYADPISPYVYIAWHRLQALRARRPSSRHVRPILLAGLLGHFGQLGPAEIAPKRVFTFKDVARRCHEHLIPCAAPRTHPFNPLPPCAPSSPPPSTTAAAPSAPSSTPAGPTASTSPTRPRSPTPSTTPASTAPALVAATHDPALKQALVDATQAAADPRRVRRPDLRRRRRAVFGQDRLPDVEAILAGRDPIDPAQVAAVLARPAGATRPR
jgi:2-hydroxychromene-2-carboxylate isomerase